MLNLFNSMSCFLWAAVLKNKSIKRYLEFVSWQLHENTLPLHRHDTSADSHFNNSYRRVMVFGKSSKALLFCLLDLIILVFYLFISFSPQAPSSERQIHMKSLKSWEKVHMQQFTKERASKCTLSLIACCCQAWADD